MFLSIALKSAKFISYQINIWFSVTTLDKYLRKWSFDVAVIRHELDHQLDNANE